MSRGHALAMQRDQHSSPKREATSCSNASITSRASAPAGGDADRVARAGGQHHQAHDRRAADLDAVLLDMDRGVEAAGELDEFGRGACMQAALVDDRKLPDRSGDLFSGDSAFICCSEAGWRR